MIEGFPQIVAAAQVGTRKAPPERATELPLEGAERTVLIELGALGLMRRAGATGFAAAPLPAAPPEARRVADAADVLEEALDESMPAALEWAREAARRGFVAPTAVVSRLVPLAAKQREFRPVLGERGRWLAKIMGVELAEPEAELPSRADWKTLGPEDRVRLVARSPEDAAFFAEALGDRRKEVREAAAARLVRSPDSAPARELRGMAEAAVAVRRSLLRTTLEVSPPDPESLPKWLPRECPVFGLGPAASALLNLIAFVPPSLWKGDPDRLLDLAARSDYAEALRGGWASAALRFDDAAWRDASFRRVFAQPLGALTEALVGGASEEAFEQASVARIRAGGQAAKEALNVIGRRNAPLSAALSREIVAVARAGVSPYALEAFGSRLDLSVLPLLDSSWPEGSAEASRLRWRKILDLRRRLLESLR